MSQYKINITFFLILLIVVSLLFVPSCPFLVAIADNKVVDKKISYVGVNVRGYYTSIQNSRYSTPFPENYYDESFKLISKAGMNHIRYVFYWEAYDRNPTDFIKEIKKVATLADKWGLNVIYDSHQFHTSSWLDPKNGTGFPEVLFQNDPQ